MHKYVNILLFSSVQWIASGSGDRLVSAADRSVEEEQGVDSLSSHNMHDMEERDAQKKL